MNCTDRPFRMGHIHTIHQPRHRSYFLSCFFFYRWAPNKERHGDRRDHKSFWNIIQFRFYIWYSLYIYFSFFAFFFIVLYCVSSSHCVLHYYYDLNVASAIQLDQLFVRTQLSINIELQLNGMYGKPIESIRSTCKTFEFYSYKSVRFKLSKATRESCF